MTAALVLCELGDGALILRVTESLGHVILEEADDVGELLEGDFGVDARRIFEVLTRFNEDRGHLFFAGDERAQAVVGRSELALHQHEGAIGDAA